LFGKSIHDFNDYEQYKREVKELDKNIYKKLGLN